MSHLSLQNKGSNFSQSQLLLLGFWSQVMFIQIEKLKATNQRKTKEKKREKNCKAYKK